MTDPSQPNPGTIPPDVTLLYTLKGHTDLVDTVAWSPDGIWIASGSDDHTIRLWNTNSGKPLHTLEGHTDWVRTVAWSPSSTRLASGSFDRTVRLWDVSSGKRLPLLKGHTDLILSVAWSPEPDGRQLASSSGDQTVRLWDVNDGKHLQTLKGHTSPVDIVVWSPNGRWLASGSRDRTIRLWDTSNGKPLHTLEGHTDWVRTVAWSPDGIWLATSSDDRTVRIWDTGSGKLLWTLKGHTFPVYSVAWSPDSLQLASGSFDGTIKLWDSSNGTLQHTLDDNIGQVYTVTWSPDGLLLASVSDDTHTGSKINIWHTTTWQSLATLTCVTGASYITWHPHLPLLATAGQQNTDICIWQLDVDQLTQNAPLKPKDEYFSSRMQQQRHFACTECGELFTETQINNRLKRGFSFIRCSTCDTEVSLPNVVGHHGKIVMQASHQPQMQAGEKATETIHIYISSASTAEDEKLLEELEKQFSMLKRQADIDFWSKRSITPGADRRREIIVQIKQAHLILVLLSPDYLDECYEEMELISEQKKAGEAHVIPVLMRHVAGWKSTPIGGLQPLPADYIPVNSRVDREETLRYLAEGIQDIVKVIRQERRSSRFSIDLQ